MNQDILELQVKTSMTKVQNLKRHLLMLNQKLSRLEEEIQTVEKSVKNHERHIALVGQKQLPDKEVTPEQQNEIARSNNSIYQIKLKVIKDSFPEYYQTMEESMPVALKESNVPL